METIITSRRREDGEEAREAQLFGGEQDGRLVTLPGGSSSSAEPPPALSVGGRRYVRRGERPRDREGRPAYYLIQKHPCV